MADISLVKDGRFSTFVAAPPDREATDPSLTASEVLYFHASDGATMKLENDFLKCTGCGQWIKFESDNRAKALRAVRTMTDVKLHPSGLALFASCYAEVVTRMKEIFTAAVE